jgi:hypothetical protein
MNAKVTAVLLSAVLASGARADQVRVVMQVIEVPHAVLTKWTGTEKLKGHELHERAMKLTMTGEAEVIDTNLLVVQSGLKALAESVSERSKPAEHDLEMPHQVEKAEQLARRVWRAYDNTFGAMFETRNVGTTMEIEPTVGKGGELVDLRFAFDVVDYIALETWTEFRDQWGDASVRMPIYGTRRFTGAITQRPGTFELCNVFTPKPAEVPAAPTRQLLFVRCDVLKAPN